MECKAGAGLTAHEKEAWTAFATFFEPIIQRNREFPWDEKAPTKREVSFEVKMIIQRHRGGWPENCYPQTRIAVLGKPGNRRVIRVGSWPK